MNSRPQLHKLGAVTAGATMLWALATSQSSVSAASPVTIGTVQGAFYASPTNTGAFDPSVLLSPAAFVQQFPVIGFNPPAGAQAMCSNVTHVDELSRPMGDVVPNPDGTCSVIPVAGNGLQAGLNPLFSFQAVFTAYLTVASAGQVAFTVFSDDGFVLGIGPQGINQPTRISGTMTSPPATGNTFVKEYPVMGALNQSSSPNANDVIVSFPAAGTYPLELDYTECCGGMLSLTLALGGTILPPPAPPSTRGTAITYTGDSSADFNDPVHLSATLQDTSVSPALVVANEPVTFAIGAQSCISTTDSTGVATCNLSPNVAAGNYAVSATFAGNATYLASSVSAPFAVTLEEDSLTYTGAVNMANGNSGMLSGSLREDGTAPVAGRSIVFTLGSGASAQSCTGTTDSAGTAACTINIAQPLGPGNIAASFASDGFYRSASAAASALIYENLAGGAFVIGDQNASVGAPVNFWGARWAAGNSLSGGLAPTSFKGFAESLGVPPATCGSTWSTDTGNSSGPPAAVPAYMAVLVTRSVSQSGSIVSGTVSEIVVVSTNPGYLNDPGHAGTGAVVAILCSS